MLIVLTYICAAVAFWAFSMLLTPIGPLAATGCMLLLIAASVFALGCAYRFLRPPP